MDYTTFMESKIHNMQYTTHLLTLLKLKIGTRTNVMAVIHIVKFYMISPNELLVFIIKHIKVLNGF